MINFGPSISPIDKARYDSALVEAFNSGYRQGKEDVLKDQTVYGYPIKEIILFAQLCSEYGITPEKLHEYYRNVETAYNIIAEDIREAQERCLKKIFRYDG